MPATWYMVTATLPDEDTRTAYLEWLEDGHLDAVKRGGASSAQLVNISEPASPLEVCSIYTFPTRELFNGYIRDYAPRLRSEGLARFGPQSGVSFRRQVGTILVSS